MEEISGCSAQIMCAVIFGVAAFRNLSLTPAVQILQEKSRGHGKYQLAKKLANALVQKGYVEIQPQVNYKDLQREKIVILKDFKKELTAVKLEKNEVLSSSSCGSTESVDVTGSAPSSCLSDPDDE